MGVTEIPAGQSQSVAPSGGRRSCSRRQHAPAAPASTTEHDPALLRYRILAKSPPLFARQARMITALTLLQNCATFCNSCYITHRLPRQLSSHTPRFELFPQT